MKQILKACLDVTEPKASPSWKLRPVMRDIVKMLDGIEEKRIKLIRREVFIS